MTRSERRELAAMNHASRSRYVLGMSLDTLTPEGAERRNAQARAWWLQLMDRHGRGDASAKALRGRRILAYRASFEVPR